MAAANLPAATDLILRRISKENATRKTNTDSREVLDDFAFRVAIFIPSNRFVL
jgi:hypothetical protein